MCTVAMCRPWLRDHDLNPYIVHPFTKGSRSCLDPVGVPDAEIRLQELECSVGSADIFLLMLASVSGFGGLGLGILGFFAGVQEPELP